MVSRAMKTEAHSSNGSSNWRGSRQAQWRLRRRIYRSALAPIEVSCFVGETAPLCALERNRGAAHVVNAKPLAVAVAEIKLGQIALQVRFAHMLVNAVNPTFQDREEAFHAIGGDEAVAFAAGVFILAVIDGLMRGEVPAEVHKRRRLVGHKMALGRGVIVEHRADIVSPSGM
jgi:hypothetical protein